MLVSTWSPWLQELSAPGQPACDQPLKQGEAPPGEIQQRWTQQHGNFSGSPWQYCLFQTNLSASTGMVCKEELGAETRVILKAIFTCKTRKKALESLSLRSVVFSPSPTPTHRAYCKVWAAPRGLCSVSQVLPLRGARGLVPSKLWKGMELKDVVREKTTWGLYHKTWFMGKVHYKRAIETEHDEDNCLVVELHNSWEVWWPKVPSLDAFWLHSCMGQEPVARRPQSRCKLGTLSPLAQKGGAFTRFISLLQLKAISASAFVILPFQKCLLLTDMGSWYVVLLGWLSLLLFVWKKEQAFWQPRDAYGPSNFHSQKQNNHLKWGLCSTWH